MNACVASLVACHDHDVYLEGRVYEYRLREQRGLCSVRGCDFFKEETHGACDKAKRSHKKVRVAQEKDLSSQNNKYSSLPYEFLPESEVVVSLNAFLNKRKVPQCDEEYLHNCRLREWLSRFFVEKSLHQREMTTYPFLLLPEDENQASIKYDIYVGDIQKVMNRLYGIFVWEVTESSKSPHAMPGWEIEKKYPNMHKILRSWRQGPFPDSFCGTIMFLLQNKLRLECFGCDMHFLQQCGQSLPSHLKPFAPGDLKYKAFYQSALHYQPRIYRARVIRFSESHLVCGNYVMSYLRPLVLMQIFTDSMIGSPDVMWLCSLAWRLMIAEVILGKRPELFISIQGIAAYINDRLEYVQFSPEHYSMNTETLNALVTVITGGKSDLQLSPKYYGMNAAALNDLMTLMQEGKSDLQLKEDIVVKGGEVFPLFEKMYGLKKGVHPHVVKKGWVSLPTQDVKGDQSFRKTKVLCEEENVFRFSMVEKVLMPSCWHDDLEMESVL
ncbi:MAG: hypothetical protein OXC30_05430 [Alphaproteobacteria bacterium]|nr:hypothetical protein [Alphaproteobacteria bacterium]